VAIRYLTFDALCRHSRHPTYIPLSQCLTATSCIGFFLDNEMTLTANSNSIVTQSRSSSISDQDVAHSRSSQFMFIIATRARYTRRIGHSISSSHRVACLANTSDNCFTGVYTRATHSFVHTHTRRHSLDIELTPSSRATVVDIRIVALGRLTPLS
jgi:hypothetical protein